MKNLNFEVMDKKTRKYATEETEKSRQFFNLPFNKIHPLLKSYVITEKVKTVRMNRDKTCYIYINNGQNILIVNDDVIYSTDGIIVWIKPEDNGDRIALFETTGSDSGTLKIFREKEIIYEENGFIHDIIFRADSFYIIKENRNSY